MPVELHYLPGHYPLPRWSDQSSLLIKRSLAALCGAGTATANVGDRADLAALGAARLTNAPKTETARALSQRRCGKPDEREKGENNLDHGAAPSHPPKRTCQ